jgi:hypothetical protein
MQGDVVRDFINRVGAAGLIVIFSLVFFAFLAGGIVAHRLTASNSAQVQQQGERQDQQGDQQTGDQQAGDQQGEQKNQGDGQSKTKPKPPSQGSSHASGSREDSPEND